MALTPEHRNHPMVLTVMIVDDQSTERRVLETIVKTIGSNISIVSFDSAAEALESARKNTPDLILTDYRMPGLNGVEFIKSLREIPDCNDVPIVVITIVDNKAVLYDSLDAGATDFLTKPVDHYQCKVRCRNLLTLRKQQLIIRNRASTLQMQIEKTVRDVHQREKEILYRLARAGEFKDPNAGIHLERIGIITRIMAEKLGLDDEFCEILEFAAAIHDIGNIGIPEYILGKSGRLTADEKRVMQKHPLIGYEIIKDSPSPYLQTGSVIALNHHERYDGGGYPQCLSGNDIPFEARIVAVADVFDALTSKRVYKDAWSIDKTLDYLGNARGKGFDPDCVDALTACSQQLAGIIAAEDKDSAGYNHDR